MGIYFPCDGQLSEAFAKANDLIRRKNEDGTPAGGMFDESRRVRAQKFRGEISDGFWMPIDSLAGLPISRFEDLHVLQHGLELVGWGGIELCRKYVSNATHKAVSNGNQGKIAKKTYDSIMFKKHFDTGQWSRNTHRVEEGDLVIITEKLHGTSQRYGHVELQENKLSWWKRLIMKLILPIEYSPFTLSRYVYMNGTRNVVLKPSNEATGFHDPSMRKLAIAPFEGNLHKGETVYFEVVGYEPSGKSIMNSVHTNKLKDKFFTSLYGDQEMDFSYMCEPGQHTVYVYRITTTNEDGISYDYSWRDVKKRCEELHVRHVPELAIITHPEWVSKDNTLLMLEVDRVAKGPSTLDATHIREGVCVRLEGGLEPRVFKHKSFEFKVLEGIIKDSNVVDMEESS